MKVKFESRICARRYVSTDAAALHAGVDDADFADCRLQLSARGRTTALPVAVAEPRPSGHGQVSDDARPDLEYAGRAARRCDVGSAKVGEEEIDKKRAWNNHGNRSARIGTCRLRVLQGGQ